MKKLLTSSRVRMLIVGGVSLTVAYLTFLLLLSIGVHYLIASVVNFLTYLIVNFTLNRNWAFKSNGDTKKEVVSHLSLHLGNQIMIMFGLYILVELFSIPPAWSQIIMQIIATITAFLITPIIFRGK